MKRRLTMAKRKQIQRRDEGMADFQNANCKKGCRFANEEKVGSGLPCCRYGSHLISDGETCYSRVTLGKDPTFTCQVCKREVKYSDLPNSIDGGGATHPAGLNWTVSMKPVYLGNGVQVPRYQAIVRDTDATIYAVVGANYVPVQNKDAFKFFDSVVGTGEAYYETAGSLRGGSRVWMLANLKGSISVKGEEVKRYLTLTNSH